MPEARRATAEAEDEAEEEEAEVEDVEEASEVPPSALDGDKTEEVNVDEGAEELLEEAEEEEEEREREEEMAEVDPQEGPGDELATEKAVKSSKRVEAESSLSLAPTRCTPTGACSLSF